MGKMDVKGHFFPIILTMGLCVKLLPSSTEIMSIHQDNSSEKASSYNQQSITAWEHLQIRWGKAEFSSKLPFKWQILEP